MLEEYDKACHKMLFAVDSGMDNYTCEQMDVRFCATNEKRLVLTQTTNAAVRLSPLYADMWTIKYGTAVDHFHTCHSVLFIYSGSHRQEEQPTCLLQIPDNIWKYYFP